MISTVAVAALALTLSAPGSQTQQKVVPISGTIQHLNYNLSNHAITPPGGLKSSPTAIFANTANNGFFFTPGAGVYNMDWGTLAAGGRNRITSFQIAYATFETGTVDIGIRFLSGATGFGVTGTEVANLFIGGLPGGSDGISPSSFAVNIDLLGAGLCVGLADGDIGWAYEFFDNNTGPLLIGPPNEAGVIDAFDQYLSSSDGYLGTFFFGGPPNPFASFWMKLIGEGSFTTFGTGCAGVGGFTPQLTMSGVGCSGNTVTLQIAGGLGGSPVALLLSGGTGSTALVNGCTIDLAFPITGFLFLGNLGGMGPGAGSLLASGTLASPPGTFFLQALVREKGAGLVSTNGVQMDVK